MMKRLITLVLVLALTFSLMACGVGTKNEEDDPTKLKESESVKTEATNQSESEKETESEKESESEETEPSNQELAFEEMVAVDNEECLIKITGIEPDNMWGYTLKVQVENKSADKTYMFSVDNAAVNGVQCDPLFVTEVAPGKKANEQINFMGDELEENGIDNYTDIELSFRVYDSDDWSADPVAEETVHVYPYGEEKAVTFTREAQASDIVIVDNAYVTAVVTGYEEDEIWGFTVNLFLLNKTDKELMFTADDVSVNGFMAEPLFATSVAAGKCTFADMTWLGDEFETNGITSVEEIEMTFRAYDFSDFFADDLANETLVLKP